MRFYRSLDVTSNSDIQHPSPMRRQGQGVVHPPETRSGGRGSDGTASAVEGLRIPEAKKTEARDTGGRRSDGMKGEKGGRRQVGATRRS